MPFTALLHQVASISRPSSSTFDDYGNPIETFVEVAGLEDVACRIQENSGSENLSDRDSLTRRAQGFFDPIDLQALDRVTVDSVVWLVEGEPVVRHNAIGPHHIEVSLTRVEI